MTKKSLKNSIFYSILGVILVFLLWFLLYFVVANVYLIPSPFIVFKNGFLTLLNLDFYTKLLSTILRVILALLLSIILGVFLAILSHIFSAVQKVLVPIISIIRSLPVLAVLLIILTFSKRQIAPVIVCVLSIFPIIYSQTLNYLNSIEKSKIKMLKDYNVPLKKQISSVYLKGYMPLFIKETASSFSFSLKLVVSAEILANVYKSIGGDILTASIYQNVLDMFSLTLIVCVIGIIVEFIGNFVYFKMEKTIR